MSRSLATLAAQINAEILRGNPNLPISGVSNLLDATPGQLAPFTNTQYAPQLLKCKATAILANSVIGAACELGDDCTIFPNVTLYHRVKIGRRVILHSGTVVGADGFGYKFRKGSYIKVPHVGWVEIADDVEVGANTCIDR